MRIAQIAPLTESVPPRLYGGTERVVSYLTEALVEMGHDVTLFASGDFEDRGPARKRLADGAALRPHPARPDRAAHDADGTRLPRGRASSTCCTAISTTGCSRC